MVGHSYLRRSCVAHRLASLVIALLLVMTQTSVVADAISRQVDTGSPANQSTAQTATPDELEIGKPVEKELSGGQSHSYRIALVAGQYLHVVVDQRGIDVVVALYGPDSKKLTEVDSPNGTNGPEPVSWIAETTAVHRIEIRSFEEQAKPGKYEVKIEALRHATAQDSHRVRAQKSHAEGLALMAERTAESLRRALEKLSEALTDWRAAGEQQSEAATLSYLGSICDSVGAKPKALEYYNQALAILRQVGDRRGVARTLGRIGGVYYSMRENQKALEYYNQALPILRQFGDRFEEARTLNNIGTIYYSLGEKQKALEYYNKTLPILRLLGDHRIEAATLTSIGEVYDSVGENQKALEYYNQALPILRQVGDRFQEARTLNDSGIVYHSLGESQKALEYYNQALPIWQRVRDRHGEARTLNNIGVVYSSLGEKQKALEYYNQALTIRQQVGDRRGEATTLSSIGLVSYSLGENQKALEYYNKTLPLLRLLGDRRGEAATLTSIGEVYGSLGENQKALEHYDRALPIQRLVGDRGGEATTLNNIGFVYSLLGENQKALEYLDQALAIRREARDQRGEVTTLNNIGRVYSLLGEKQKALEYLDQALVISRQVKDRRREAVTLNNLGVVYSSLGENRKAAEYFKQALPIRREVGDRRGEPTTLGSIAQVYSLLGEKQKALEYYDRALTIQRLVGDRRAEATTLNYIGLAYKDLGEKQKALEYFNQALTISRQVVDRSGEAGTLNNIGAVYKDLGEKQKALEYFNEALTMQRQVGDCSCEGAILGNIALVYRDTGRLLEARTNVEAALNIVESVRTNVLREELRLSYTSSVQELYALNIDLLMKMHRENPLSGFDSTALEASERGRARSLLELLNESHANIKQGVDPKLLEQECSVQQLLNAKAERLTSLLSGRHTEEQAAAARKEVVDLTDKLHDIEHQIREKSPHYAALTQPQPLSLEQIQKLLDPETLLLEYSLGPERSYLWAVTRDSYKSYELPKVSEIKVAAQQFYDSLRSPGPVRKSRRRRTGSEPVYTADSLRRAEGLSRKLSTMLLSPVASMLGDKRLAIVPDGGLQYLPFAALADPASPAKWEPLILRHEIVSLPSASALAIQRKELEGRKPAPKTAIVFADPVFSTDDDRIKPTKDVVLIKRPKHAKNESPSVKVATAKRDATEVSAPLYQLAMTRAVRNTRYRTMRDGLPRLPGSRLEGEEIVGLAGKDQSKLIVDFAANRAAVESEELSQYRYVHFATHGLLDSQNPELSALVLSLVDEEGRTQDGYLRAHQIFNLKLPAEVVVLSACETGLGKEVRGEGLVGITRGFMYAGAKRVVVSLWSVNDRSTAELMTNFYRGMLEEGKTPAAALRAAQIRMITDPKMKQWRSPYYWAPFILQGEWR